MIDLVVLDVGNTALKVGLFAGDRLVDRAAFSHEDADSLSNARSFVHRAGATARLAVCSVDPDRAAKIVSSLRPAASEETSGRPALVAPRDFTAPVRNDCDPPDSVGLDRLFNAAAVAGAPRPVVVVDAGTAVTVDRVEPPGVFRGGAIAPGLRVSFAALNAATAKLPLVTLPAASEDVPALGRDTASAIRSGVVRGVAGAIERLVRDLGGHRDADVVLTGGDAARLAPLLDPTYRHDPDLTLRGIARGARAVTGAAG